MHLVIEKQESLAQDKFSKNGVTKEIFFVAKNIPFNIVVSSPFINLGVNPLTAKLYYDFNSLVDLREVETLKCQPIEYVSHVNETGDRATVEIRAAVLSSQHEQALFRVKLSAIDAKNKKAVEVFSYPIKVISKRNQAKRMIEKNELVATDPIPPPKRATTDQITEALARLEQQQKEQSQLIKLLLSKEQKSTHTINLAPVKEQSRPVSIPDPNDADFETAFKRFLDVFAKVPEEERQSKIRKTLGASNNHDLDAMNDFVRHYVDVATGTPTDTTNMENGFLNLSDSEFEEASSPLSNNVIYGSIGN